MHSGVTLAPVPFDFRLQRGFVQKLAVLRDVSATQSQQTFAQRGSGAVGVGNTSPTFSLSAALLGLGAVFPTTGTAISIFHTPEPLARLGIYVENRYKSMSYK
jgi:hypothetical protein